MYYLMECLSPDSGYIPFIEPKDDDPDRYWIAAERFETLPALPVDILVRWQKDSVLAEFWATPLPVMSGRLRRALDAAGVANVDFYAARLLDPKGKLISDDYFAFNIVGAIAAADMAATEFSPDNPERLVAADIDKLAIDPAKTRGSLFFRLAESLDGIVVHASVRQAIEAAGINTITFMDPGEWVS